MNSDRLLSLKYDGNKRLLWRNFINYAGSPRFPAKRADLAPYCGFKMFLVE
jgi:hypothetical protein